MKRIILILLIAPQFIVAQKLKKADKALIGHLQSHISYLADDKLEGRRAGTKGEQMAVAYISEQFKQVGLLAKGDAGGFVQAFNINEGKQINASTHFFINGNDLKTGTDFFPFSFSPNKSVEATTAIALHETGSPWFFDLAEELTANKSNPHFDLAAFIQTKIKDVAAKGASALILFNTSSITDELHFNSKDKTETSPIPVFYLSKSIAEKFCHDVSAPMDVKMKTDIGEKTRTAHNVAGYIDNGAATTIVLGAHFDHLGYGEDGNSRNTGSVDIHNGADDNASGTGALIELARLLLNTKAKKNNYLFLAFSAEELGLFGSKYYVEHPTVDIAKVNYMINMDMVGRLSDSSHALTVGGYGTSPVWAEAFPALKDKYFFIRIDSSGTGPSDHTSFYRKDIPVLFFFTGLHTDYHTPTDDADKINYTGELLIIKYIYKLIESLDGRGKLAFTKTREQSMGTNTRFRVTLGIMPDYTFTGEGVRADGVSEGKPAAKAGVKTGDIVLQIGDFATRSMDDYMKALGKFTKGDSVKLKIKRGNEELLFDITF
jgi:aminopeptidase YwaD